MRCVIFDPEDMEAITVIWVPDEYLHEIAQGKRGPVLCFPIMPKPVMAWELDVTPAMDSIRTASILFERFVRRAGGREVVTWCGIATDVELALALKSEFLPGQQKEAWEERRRGVTEGIAKAFGAMRF